MKYKIIVEVDENQLRSVCGDPEDNQSIEGLISQEMGWIQGLYAQSVEKQDPCEDCDFREDGLCEECRERK